MHVSMDQITTGIISSPPCWAFECQKLLTTRYSPYNLMFGREAGYLAEVPEEYEVRFSNGLFLLKDLIRIIYLLYILTVICGR